MTYNTRFSGVDDSFPLRDHLMSSTQKFYLNSKFNLYVYHVSFESLFRFFYSASSKYKGLLILRGAILFSK